MTDAGLQPGPVLCGTAFTEPEGARLAGELIDEGATAIVAGNDLMALGCYDVLAERGLRCPDDISVVGFNDMPFSERFNPPLTTIRIPHYEIGASAADLLLDRLQDPDAPARHIVLAPGARDPRFVLDNPSDLTIGCTRLLQSFARGAVEEEPHGDQEHTLDRLGDRRRPRARRRRLRG